MGVVEERPDPVETLAYRIAHIRAEAQSLEPVHPRDVVATAQEREEARRIVHGVRLEVRVEKAARSARLTFYGLAWVIAGVTMQILFSTIFEVPVMSLVGAVCSLVGLLTSASALGVMRREHKAERAKDPAWLRAVMEEQAKVDKARRRAQVKAKVAAAKGRLHRGR